MRCEICGELRTNLWKAWDDVTGDPIRICIDCLDAEADLSNVPVGSR